MTISLRKWNDDDLEDLISAANNAHIAQFLTDSFPHPYSADFGRQFISLAQDKNAGLRLAISIDGKAIGGIGIHPQTDIFRKNAELGYWLSEDYWGKGIATQAVQQIVPIAFENFAITRLYARVYGNNIASQKVMAKSGFEKEAHFKNSLFKNGQFLDELIYAIRK